MQETTYQLNTPCSIALLADIHNQPGDKILASLTAHRPEMICIAGDLVNGHAGNTLVTQTKVHPLLEGCVELAPTFLSIGNHDWILTPEDMEVIRGLGVTVLDNGWTSWNGIHIGGLTSGIAVKIRTRGWDGTNKGSPPETDWLDAFEQLPGYRILLCHHPEYFPAFLHSRSIDLILSGHAHGGQWRFFGRGVFAPQQGLFPKYTSGVHTGSNAGSDGDPSNSFGGNQTDNLRNNLDGGQSDVHGRSPVNDQSNVHVQSRMVISRGLANTCGYAPRINNPTEIVYIK